jgi:transposase
VEKLITYTGLDVRKETVALALADGSKRGEVREYGKIFDTPAALAKLASKLGQGSRKLELCYEAGPCGYGIQRQLSAEGSDCIVIAPSLIPTRTGDRIEIGSPRRCLAA